MGIEKIATNLLGSLMKSGKVIAKRGIIPEAKVLSSKPNPDSITKDSYYYAKNSAIADADDQTKAYKKAEKEMEKTAANDTVLLAQAQQRVQSMLEDYVKNMGTMLGKEYTITWDIKENHVKPDTAESTE